MTRPKDSETAYLFLRRRKEEIRRRKQISYVDIIICFNVDVKNFQRRRLKNLNVDVKNFNVDV